MYLKRDFKTKKVMDANINCASYEFTTNSRESLERVALTVAFARNFDLFVELATAACDKVSDIYYKFGN